MDGGAWWAAVHGVTRSWTWLSDFPFTFHFHALEKEMATHSSVLAWRIPGMGEPGGLPSAGVTQSWTWLKRLSSTHTYTCVYMYLYTFFNICGWPSVSFHGVSSSILCFLYILHPPKWRSILHVFCIVFEYASYVWSGKSMLDMILQIGIILRNCF